MHFCEKCGALLHPKKENGKVVWVCLSCGAIYTNINGGKSKISDSKITSKKDDKMIIVEKNEEALPITEKECPKCGNKTVYWWTQQTRASDEPETRFYKCTKCKYVWREYS